MQCSVIVVIDISIISVLEATAIDDFELLATIIQIKYLHINEFMHNHCLQNNQPRLQY